MCVCGSVRVLLHACVCVWGCGCGSAWYWWVLCAVGMWLAVGVSAGVCASLALRLLDAQIHF